jgi:hypothetical protein
MLKVYSFGQCPEAKSLNIASFGYLDNISPSDKPKVEEDIILNPNHVDEGVDLLLEQFKKPLKSNPNNPTRLVSLLRTLLCPVQDLENMMVNFAHNIRLNVAVGVALDNLGGIAGISRGVMDDVFYRMRIRAQQIINHSNGRYEDMYNLLNTMTDVFSVIPVGGARVDIVIGVSESFLSDDLIIMIRQNVATGIGVNLMTKEESGKMFKLTSLGSPDPINGGGLYDLVDPNPSFAGKLLNLIQE